MWNIKKNQNRADGQLYHFLKTVVYFSRIRQLNVLKNIKKNNLKR